MPVFQNLLAVGVSGAITFIYLGQGIAVPISVDSTERTSGPNSISQTSFKQNAVKPQSAPSNADATPPSHQSSQVSPEASQQDSVSDTVAVSIKQNPSKPTPEKPTSQRAIINNFTTVTPEENPTTLNKAQSSLSHGLKQNLTLAGVTDSTLQRILDKFIASSSNQPTPEDNSSSVETVFKQNPQKPTTQTGSTSRGAIINNLASTSSNQPTVENNSSSVETAFKENPQKPTTPTGSTSQGAILNNFGSTGSNQPTVEDNSSSVETVFKQNPQKPTTPTGSTSRGAIINNLASTSSNQPTVEDNSSSVETVFKQNPQKPTTPTGSTSRGAIINNLASTSSNQPTVEDNSSSVETVFKENPQKPTTQTGSTSQGAILNNFGSTGSNQATVEDSQSSVETVFKENPAQPSTLSNNSIPTSLDSIPTTPTTSRLSPPSPIAPLNTQQTAPLNSQQTSGNETPNLLELPRVLPESISGNPPQIAQTNGSPTLEVPDLSPPEGPYPLPTPNGTLRTNPPPITLPSSNPLYTPNQPREVEIQETVPITLPQAVDLARRNNEEIRVFELQVEQNLAALRQAQADLYPTLSWISTISRGFSAGEDIVNSARNRETEQANERIRAENERIRAENQNREEQQELRQAITLSRTFGSTTFQNTLQLQYDFDLSGARGARIKAAEEQLRLARLEFERSVEQLRLDVTEAYYNLQEADAEVEIQRAAVRNAQKSLEDAEALERAGVGTRFEVLQARVTLSRVQQDLTNAISNQRTRRRELANILNVSQNVNLIAADAISLAGAWGLTLDESIVLAYNNRAELQQELVNRNLAEQRRIAARAAQRPNLTTTANYNVLGRLDDNSDPFANQGWADGYDIQLQMRWNFFDGGLAKANARQQEINIAIAEERYSELRNDIRLEVESAFYDLQATFENIGVANLGVEEATEALRLARLRFQAGVGTQLDVINQETDLTRAQNQLLQAIIGYNRSLSRLQRAVSNLPDNNLQAVP
ncbi:TolC family protein [Capilliphycus salinus ALCB114379]|uniref:TolC family protein n=1 Tax=Capilliphycus salinus TaxID=2768948 RepID=UPI0039A58A72